MTGGIMREQNTAPIARRTVRKRLDDDCLLDGQVHPSIAERLDRIRELPVGNVANLQRTERDSEGVWLVWQFIDGMTLEEYLAQPRSEAERSEIVAQVRRIVA